jgi:hypothetical protein
MIGTVAIAELREAVDECIARSVATRPAAEAVHGYAVGARAELEHTPDREVPEEQMLPSCRTIGSHTRTSYRLD